MNERLRSRTIDDLVRHIDTRLSRILARPKMYAPNPEALESLVLELDGLRRFARGESDNPLATERYARFLRDKGFDAASFCSRRDARNLTREDLEVFQELAAFLNEYLQSE